MVAASLPRPASGVNLWRSEGGPWLPQDYPYFNLRLTSLEVEAETLRRAKTRAVGGCSLGGPTRADGVVRVFLAPESAPSPPPALVYYDNTPSVLKAALGRVRLPAVGSGRKSIPLARRVGGSFQRPLESYVRHTGRILSIGAQAARDRHSPRPCSPDRPRIDAVATDSWWTSKVHRCLRWSGASLPAIWRSVRNRAPI